MAKKSKPDESETVDPKSPVIDLKAEEIFVEPEEKSAEASPDPEPAADQTAPPPPPPKPRTSWRLWGSIGLVALAALAGAWGYKTYGGRFWPSDEMTALATRLSAVEAENQTLTNQLQGLGAAIDEVRNAEAARQQHLNEALVASKTATETARGLEQRMAGLEQQTDTAAKSIEALKTSMTQLRPAAPGEAPAPDLAQLTALEQRVTALEQKLAAGMASRMPEAATRLTQTLADLKAKLTAGAPYAEELQEIAAAVPAAPDLELLSGTAETGVPSIQSLADEARTLSETLLPTAVAPPAPADDGYWGTFTGLLGQLVTVRQIGETDWRTAAARAAAAAAAGNIGEAITATAGEGDMPPELKAWRDKAETRLAADRAIIEVSEAVLRQIAASGGTTP
jgi:hypothetical protein